ncbi:hypothetical protein V8C44DRAFT_251086 [Trichoderma aethiopicum]
MDERLHFVQACASRHSASRPEGWFYVCQLKPAVCLVFKHRSRETPAQLALYGVASTIVQDPCSNLSGRCMRRARRYSRLLLALASACCDSSSRPSGIPYPIIDSNLNALVHTCTELHNAAYMYEITHTATCLATEPTSGMRLSIFAISRVLNPSPLVSPLLLLVPPSFFPKFCSSSSNPKPPRPRLLLDSRLSFASRYLAFDDLVVRHLRPPPRTVVETSQRRRLEGSGGSMAAAATALYFMH